MKPDREAMLRQVQLDTLRQVQDVGEEWLRSMRLGTVRGDQVLASFLAFWGRQRDELAAYDRP